MCCELQVCQEAALGPIRELGAAALRTVKAEDVRNLNEQVYTLRCMFGIKYILYFVCLYYAPN